MEKFKNALKSVNKFGLLAIALVAIALMSFKEAPNKKVANVLWGKDSTVPLGWRNLSSIAEDSSAPFGDDTYHCNSNPSQVCSAQFDSSAPPTSPSSTPIPGTERNGNFVYVEP